MEVLKIRNQETGEWVEITAIKGENGQDGKTPVKGVDYFTEEDKQELIDSIQVNGTGVEEVYVGTTAPTDENIKIWVDTTELTEEIATEDYVDTEIDTLKNYVDAQIAAAIPSTVEGVEF